MGATNSIGLIHGDTLSHLVPGGHLSSPHDSIELKQAEEVFQQRADIFGLLVDAVKDYAIIMVGPDGRVASWNPGAERIKGYRAEEIIGQNFSRFYPDEDIECGKPEKVLTIAATQGRLEEQGWRVRKDGSRFWANVIIIALRDAAGRLRGFAKVTRDLTERRRVDPPTSWWPCRWVPPQLALSSNRKSIRSSVRLRPRDFVPLASGTGIFHKSVMKRYPIY